MDLLGLAPTRLGSTPLAGEMLAHVASSFGMHAREGAEYFLDFDAEQEPGGHQLGVPESGLDGEVQIQVVG